MTLIMKRIYKVLDIGNTNMELGLYDSEAGLVSSWRLSSDKLKTEDEYYTIIIRLLEHCEVNASEVVKIAIASVVPSLTRVFSHMAEKYFQRAELIVVSPYTPMGITFLVNDPGFIGVDLIVNAFSALQKYRDNCIICDLGTATTIQLVTKEGLFAGTVIAPGVITGSGNLFEKTALLPNIELQIPEVILGTNTENSMQSGIMRGTAYMLDGFIAGIKKEHQGLGNFKTIITGGISKLIYKLTRDIDIIDTSLTIDGLYFLCAQESRKQGTDAVI